ncbi:hypothetical protein B0H14DRAFT_3562667 [Mycena olivaceomarginata]|nr:hypothetical protein B0H14DRAFT_3562667 [Mycena olivaceomarginata]
MNGGAYLLAPFRRPNRTDDQDQMKIRNYILSNRKKTRKGYRRGKKAELALRKSEINGRKDSTTARIDHATNSGRFDSLQVASERSEESKRKSDGDGSEKEKGRVGGEADGEEGRNREGITHLLFPIHTLEAALPTAVATESPQPYRRKTRRARRMSASRQDEKRGESEGSGKEGEIHLKPARISAAKLCIAVMFQGKTGDFRVHLVAGLDIMFEPLEPGDVNLTYERSGPGRKCIKCPGHLKAAQVVKVDAEESEVWQQGKIDKCPVGHSHGEFQHFDNFECMCHPWPK